MRLHHAHALTICPACKRIVANHSAACDCESREAASRSTELGANQSPKRRLGATGRRHSWLLRHQVQITAFLSVLAFAALIWVAKP
jgi:hypothetical protein